MNILVLSDRLHPTPNANGLCLINIVREMERIGHSLWNVDRVDSLSLENKSERTICFYKKNILSWVACNSIKERFVYIIKRLFGFLRYPKFDGGIVDRYVKEALSFSDINEVDVIFCICNPVETVEAALRIKSIYPSLKLIIYNIDTISDIPFPKIDKPIAGILAQKALKWENEAFSQADVIVNLKCHENHFRKKQYKEYHSKMLFQDIPMLVRPSTGADINRTSGGRQANLVYAGSFYRQLREPSLLLDLFDNDIFFDYTLQIFTSKSYCNIIRHLTGHNNHIVTCDYMNADELEKVIINTDFLVSLGNKQSNMFPSKIVSYVAYGKPIIHIYQDDMDPVPGYLEQYPDKLLVDIRDELSANRQKVAEYIKNKHRLIPWEGIYSIYMGSTPDYNTKQITNKIK